MKRHMVIAAVLLATLGGVGYALSGWAPLLDANGDGEPGGDTHPTQRKDAEPTAQHPRSQLVSEIRFDHSTSRRRAPGSDIWVVTWADDGHQYTSWGDGGGFGGTNHDGRVSLGFGRIRGGPRNYETTNLWGGKNAPTEATMKGKCWGLLDVDGTIWAWRGAGGYEGSEFEYQELYRTTDHFESLEPAGVRFDAKDYPADSESRMYAPTFCQFGKGYAGARDDYVYIYAPENHQDIWEVQRPGEISLMRVPKAQLANEDAYAYFAGLDQEDAPRWSDAIGDREPVFRDAVNGVMRTSVSYNPGLKRYFLITQQVSRFKKKNGHIGIYEAPQPWGPWRTVLFENCWETGLHEGYKTVFWNFSNKWLGPEGRHFVLIYTGPGPDNFGTIEGELAVHEGRAE